MDIIKQYNFSKYIRNKILKYINFNKYKINILEKLHYMRMNGYDIPYLTINDSYDEIKFVYRKVMYRKKEEEFRESIKQITETGIKQIIETGFNIQLNNTQNKLIDMGVDLFLSYIKGDDY